MLLGIDTLMDMGRTAMNVIGNCMAAAVVAKWEGELALPQANLTHNRCHPEQLTRVCELRLKMTGKWLLIPLGLQAGH